ncbi:MAG TPA: nucleotide sugar dehydrogenase [Alphaproteobacteria bacterium]|nr:nucleotide sugar dehydrogenase [Alphaproteobacteria bacterium]
MTSERGHREIDVAAAVARLRERRARIGVIGLGYVGLPLVTALCDRGFPVVGFDVDAAKIDSLAAGRSYIRHIDGAAIGRLVAGGAFAPTADFARLAEVDAILICVPTPLTRHREPDLSYVVQTTETVARHLRPGQLVVLESTTYPGTTGEVMRPILEAGGLKSGRDFFLAYSPEREDPGNIDFNTSTVPKVVGGDGPDALDLAVALYDQITVRTVPVSSPETAEAVKLTENIFRSVNIALVNELKVVYEAMGIDIWEVIDAAKTKPFGFMPFYPGPGLGGHCIPIDPFYLTWKAREFGLATRFIELSGEINTAMPRHVVARVAQALDRAAARGLNGARILVVGVAYKKNVDDMRESPALAIIEQLEERGAVVEYYDPYFPEIPMTREHARLAGRRSVAWTDEVLAGFDAAVITTDHDGVDYAALVARSKLVVDTRNATRDVRAGRGRIVKA